MYSAKPAPSAATVPATLTVKNHPAVKEGDKFSVGFAKIDILPAGFREHSAHLGKSEAGRQGNQHADDPDGEKQYRRARVRCHVGSGKKNARPDDSAG